MAKRSSLPKGQEPRPAFSQIKYGADLWTWFCHHAMNDACRSSISSVSLVSGMWVEDVFVSKGCHIDLVSASIHLE